VLHVEPLNENIDHWETTLGHFLSTTFKLFYLVGYDLDQRQPSYGI